MLCITSEFILAKKKFGVRCTLRKQLIRMKKIIKPEMFLFTKSVLQSVEVEERLAVTKLLGQMFSEKDSELATQNKPLWNSYLGR